ncbi:MAG: DNA-binding protein WhiA [Ruminococcus sp.]|nr:DNA-binding protein WhiA [Ruminococcus sp.]
MPSFSYTVKEELVAEINDRDKKFACLYSMLLFCKQFDRDGISIQTEHDKVAELFISLVDDVLRKKGAVTCVEKKKKTGMSYLLTVNSREDTEKLLNIYRCFNDGDTRRIITGNFETNSLGAFLAGAFLAAGSMIDPNNSYHLEYITPHRTLCDEFCDTLKLIGVTAKISERKGNYIVYIKESENIEDVLTFMGASMSSLEIMNVKILKDVRNKANRIANCDSANIEKTIAASYKQIDDIEYIMNTAGFDSLSDELREIAEARMENPDMSLRELGQALTKPISRSGVNHRMRKLSLIAEELRKRK